MVIFWVKVTKLFLDWNWKKKKKIKISRYYLTDWFYLKNFNHSMKIWHLLVTLTGTGSKPYFCQVHHASHWLTKPATDAVALKIQVSITLSWRFYIVKPRINDQFFRIPEFPTQYHIVVSTFDYLTLTGNEQRNYYWPRLGDRFYQLPVTLELTASQRPWG